MRVQLSIHRQGLPPVNLLWGLPDHQTRPKTIAQLLEDINDIVPLESEEWGLEDYVAQLGKFECLHFSTVQELLKEDDNLVIRPLHTDDIRTRTLTGRHQITADGRHLYDGIPFGRPYLKRPTRPEVRIPGRRTSLPITANNNGNTVASLQANGSNEELVDSHPDLRRIAFGEGSRDDNQLPLTNGLSRPHRVRFSDEDDDHEQASVEPALDEEESEDYMPSDTDSDNEGEESGDSDDLSSDSDMSFDSSNDEDHSTMDSSEHGGDQIANLDGATSGADDSTYASRSVDSMASDGDTQYQEPPGQGKIATKSRNKRRRLHTKLVYHKARGNLPSDAKFEDLDQMLQSIKQGSLHSKGSQHSPGHVNHDTTHLIDASRDEPPSFTDAAPTSPPTSTSHRASLEAVDSTIISDEISNIQDDSSATNDQAHSGLSSSPLLTSGQSGISNSSRKKLNVAAASRLVYGSLGLKNPNRSINKDMPSTTSDSRLTGAPISGEKSVTTSQQSQAPIEQATASDDPDFWRSRINLIARECVMPTLQPLVPPFPYRHPRGKKRYRDHDQDDTVTDTPDYDGDDSSACRDWRSERKYTLPGQLDERASKKPKIYEEPVENEEEKWTPEKLPKLPDDMTKFPALTRDNISVGSIIAYRCLELNNFDPRIGAYKAAEVMAWKPAEGLLELKPPELQEEEKEAGGLLEKFGVEGGVDEFTEEGFLVLSWDALQEPKFLL